MAFQVSGCTVIDNNRNIVNTNNMCVGVVTMTGSSGNIETPGTITAGGFDFPANIVSFDPPDGAIGVNPTRSLGITIIFNQAVGIATTGTILIKEGSASGLTAQTIGVGNIQSIPNGIIIKTTSPQLSFSTIIVPVIPEGFIQSTGGSFIGLNTTGADSYSFTTKSLELGDEYEGGTLICCASPLRWVVAPQTAELSTTWHLRNDANTIAQQVSGCTGWFVPTCNQLINPGFNCREYWDFSSDRYWSNTQANTTYAWKISLINGSGDRGLKGNIRCVRSFRCVTY
jgi:hypothetical protein